ncbi:MAG: formylglycine-generating enzyme family protein [Phycisphaerae bacterium]
MAIKLFSRKPTSPAPAANPIGEMATGADADQDYQPAPPKTPHPDALYRLLQQHRYATVIAEGQRWAEHRDYEQIGAQAERRLEKDMGLVPAGNAALATTLDDEPGGPEQEFEIEPFLLALHPVTNARFQQFVDAGGYDNLALWPEATWPHLIELHDQTGNPGPRFWRQGRHDLRCADHPVVGISWYEANAYAKWVGLRLPTEAEWQMAASWRIKSEADVFRRFPWGDAMDYECCNLWGTGLASIQPVDSLPKGCAPNGVQQLIGNTWEWTDGDFEVTDADGQIIVAEMPMKAVRGGAYDTYFETQATSTFRTGQILLSRTHNTGFRCAMDI